MGDGQAGVDDVLHDEHVLVLDGTRQVLRDLHDAARLRPLAVRAHAEEVDAQRQVDGAHQVGREDEAPLEHADQHQVASGVVARDVRAELADARGDLLGGEHGDDAFAHGLLRIREVGRGRQRPRASAATSSVRPSVVTVTAPSWSVRQTRTPAAASVARVSGWGCPKRLRQPAEMTASLGTDRLEEGRRRRRPAPVVAHLQHVGTQSIALRRQEPSLLFVLGVADQQQRARAVGDAKDVGVVVRAQVRGESRGTARAPRPARRPGRAPRTPTPDAPGAPLVRAPWRGAPRNRPPRPRPRPVRCPTARRRGWRRARWQGRRNGRGADG